MDIVISIASKIAESLVTPIGREFGYLIYYDTNLKDLKDELKQLFEMKDGVQELVNAAKRNGEVINHDVQSWLTSVNELIQKVSHFEEEVNMKRRCLYRWNISRKATKITQDVRHLQKERTFNNNVAHPAPPPMIWSTFKEGFKDFKSRMTCVNSVIEVLKNEEVRMIGICGMGGVGKTTMVKEIIKRLAGLKVFDNVVMAVVSQSPSIRKIQSEIADELGFTYDREDSEIGRALRLNGRLKQINKILIVLDDVWTELDFEAIGLPSGLTHKGCKVLLTSRNRDVCNEMGSQENFTIPVLTPEESWELFREMVGKPLDYPDLAKRVTNECAGLPLAILTVAKALENARKYEWDDALKQLQSSVWDNRVHSSIHWSYDRLESDEAKSCLLLCCLFPEDYDIPIEYLVRYGWGRGYFSNIDSVDEARNRVHSLVDKLQRRFLLLDSERKDHTKMHDIVRDVAIQIASRDPHRFLIRCDAEKKGWPKVYDHYTTISLIPINIDEIPVGLECPKLGLLHLEDKRYSENSMDNMCEGMKELKVLGIGGISALPSSLGVLKSLRTLSLNGCRYLTDISDVIGRLENLEILSFRECVDILELPREIGLLKHLRLLDITDCNSLEKIPHGLLSSLSSLEELYMGRSFCKWERSAAESEDKGMASLVEDQNVVGTSYDEHQSSRSFERAVFPSKCILWLQNLEEVKLYNTDDIVDVLFDMKGHMVPAFSHLQKLVISFASRCQHLWKNIPREFQGFQNLRYLKVGHCRDLQYVFPHSIAKLLVNLEELNIAECRKMETIVRSADENEKEDQTGMTLFPKLNSFDLEGLRSLESLCHDASTSLWSAAKVMSVVACHKLKTLASVIPQIKKLEKDSKAHHEDEDEGISSGSCGCTPYSCGPMTKPSSRTNIVQILPRLVNQEVAPTNLDQDSNDYDNLERLSVNDCESLEVVFQLKGQAFNKLCYLLLDGLPSLMHVWETGGSQHITGFGNLTFLSVSDCGSLRYLFLSTVAKLLVSLKDLKVRNCEKIEQVIAKADTECADQEITFPQLNSMTLKDLPNLICFSTEAYTLKLPSLMKLEVISCPDLRTFASEVVNTHSRIQVHTELGKSEWMGDLNSSIGNIHEKRETQRSAEVTTPKDENVVGTSYDGHQSSRSFERAVFPSKCILWLQNLEEVTLEYANGIVDVLFDLKGHMVPAFSHLRKLEILLEFPCQHLWKNIPRGFQGFQNLRYLKIGGGDLQYVFPHSIARLLVNLEELNILECWKLETIVRSADENEKEDQTGMTLFPKLNSFYLDGLQSLENLCPDASTSFWSAAKVMSVVECHELKTLVAPTNLDQDSNDYDNLERLSVDYCESLEVVFQLKGPKAVESHNVQAFNKLCYLSLYKLPRLTHVWETGGSQHITGFGNLTFLSVSFCGSLRYLFLSTVAKLLVSLKGLKVGYCKKIEQVIAKADTECADQEITFPQLNSMTLKDLPNLICFSTEAYTLKLPSLMELKVKRCPDLRTFASKVVNTHSVIQVDTELGKSEWMGDLNSTIGNIHEKRETQRSAEHVDEFSSEEYNEEQVDEEVNSDSTELWEQEITFDTIHAY